MPRALIPFGLFLAACASPVGVAPPPVDTAAAPEREASTEPFNPKSERKEMSVGGLILDCNRHLRTWQEAMGRSRTQENSETIRWTEAALAALVNREREKLEQEAATGPTRNRAIASAALGFAPGPRTLTYLLNNLNSQDPFVLANTLLGIGAMGDAETPLDILADTLLKEDLPLEVTRNGLFAGHRLAARLRDDPGGHLSRLFLSHLDFPDTGVRAQAASGLGLTRSGIAVEALAHSLRGDSEALVRTAAAFALGEIGSPAGISVLTTALRDPSLQVSGTARGSLRKIELAGKASGSRGG